MSNWKRKELDLERLMVLMEKEFPNCNPVIDNGYIRATFGNCSMPLDFEEETSEEECIVSLKCSLRLANYS